MSASNEPTTVVYHQKKGREITSKDLTIAAVTQGQPMRSRKASAEESQEVSA
jgi:hypothetical protein